MQDLHWHGSSCVGSFTTLGGRVLMLPAPAGSVAWSSTWAVAAQSRTGTGRPGGGAAAVTANFRRGHGLEKMFAMRKQQQFGVEEEGLTTAPLSSRLFLSHTHTEPHFSTVDPHGRRNNQG